ncbi:MAG TPA: NB-ARC domain-containing protein [Candidatus Angelobacter sp.]|nr:NB-ARC domain-containing protein [Candidatus Angelobacter sp.]
MAPEQAALCYLPAFNPEAFVGRMENLHQLEEWTARSGMSLVSGEPGSGKSTLALMFAWQAQQQRRFDAVVYQTCGRRSVEAIAADLADTLREHLAPDVMSMPADQKLRAAKQWLNGRHSLFVLDDLWLEPVSSAQNDRLGWRDLLPGPRVTIVFTSRQRNLPGVTAGKTLHIEAFTESECELAFEKHLGPEMAGRYGEALLEFARRVERLPIAVVVGADLLRRQLKPLNVAQRGLTLEKLRNEVHNVADLFQRAIASQGENEQKLLAAAAVCVAEGFWLPLAGQIAGLEVEEAEAAAEALVNSSLLQLKDRERQRFHLHSLLYEQLHRSAPSFRDLLEKHAQALGLLFQQWEARWKDCRECLAEIIPAVRYLHSFKKGDGNWLSYYGYATAQRVGELDAALRIEQENESLWRSAEGRENKDALQRSYGNQALILRDWGRLEEAMILHKKEEALCLELGNEDELQASYGNQAIILQLWGRLEDAMALHKKQEALSLELGNKDGLQASYGNQAIILQLWGRLEEAIALQKKQEDLCLELGNKDSLQRSYGSQAIVLKLWGRPEEAMALFKKAEALSEELGDKDSLQRSYGNQATILQAWGRLEEAMAFHKKEEDLCEELGNKDGLQASYINQARILRHWGRLEEAMTLLKRSETLSNELGNKRGIAHCSWSWGLLAREMKDQETARARLHAALEIFTELKMPRERDAVQDALDEADQEG